LYRYYWIPASLHGLLQEHLQQAPEGLVQVDAPSIKKTATIAEKDTSMFLFNTTTISCKIMSERQETLM